MDKRGALCVYFFAIANKCMWTGIVNQNGIVEMRIKYL